MRISPSLTFTGNFDKTNSAFSIRGVGTNTFGINVEQAVAYIVDDVASIGQGESIENLADIERIEVLRGPQSTLFGKSASAGAILVTTKAPSEEFEGSVQGTLTDDDEYRILASVSGPIGDTLGYRISGYWNNWDGNVTNLYDGSDGNSTENWGVRGKLRWDITDTVDATLTGYYSEDDDTCCMITWRTFDPDARLLGFIPEDPIVGIQPGDDNDKARMDDGWKGDTQASGTNLHLNIGLDEFTLKSITAFSNWQYDTHQDVDVSDIDVGFYLTGGLLSGGFYQDSTRDSDSCERASAARSVP